MDFNVIDFLCDLFEKGLHSTEVSIGGGKRGPRSGLWGLSWGIWKELTSFQGTGAQWEVSRREGRDAEGSTEWLGRGRLQEALRHGDLHLGPLGSKAGVRTRCWISTISPTGRQAWETGNRGSKGVTYYKVMWQVSTSIRVPFVSLNQFYWSTTYIH